MPTVHDEYGLTLTFSGVLLRPLEPFFGSAENDGDDFIVGSPDNEPGAFATVADLIAGFEASAPYAWLNEAVLQNISFTH